MVADFVIAVVAIFVIIPTLFIIGGLIEKFFDYRKEKKKEEDYERRKEVFKNLPSVYIKKDRTYVNILRKMSEPAYSPIGAEYDHEACYTYEKSISSVGKTKEQFEKELKASVDDITAMADEINKAKEIINAIDTTKF